MGGEGIPPPININPSVPSTNASHNASSNASTTTHPTGGGGSTHPVSVILCILPANKGATVGYIHLAYGEIIHQAAVIAYFDSAGQEVVVIPCPNFEAFLAIHLLCTRNVSFLSDLLDYILESGCRILEANEFSSSDVCPDLSWLPKSPSPSATSPSSQSLLSHLAGNVRICVCRLHPPNTDICV
jgi:hypothetical protein